MVHRLHLPMKNSDHENILRTWPVKNGVLLVVVTPHTFRDVGALTSHERGSGQESKSAFQVIGIIVSLLRTKIKKGVFVNSCEIGYGEVGQLIHGVFVLL